MKHFIVGSVIAATLALSSVSLSTPASAVVVRVGPRGVGVGLGGFRRGFVGPRFVRPGFGVRRFGPRPFIRRGFRRF